MLVALNKVDLTEAQERIPALEKAIRRWAAHLSHLGRDRTGGARSFWKQLK